jgi:3-dehydroquinate dehydratase/shikimate dehydrogenase
MTRICETVTATDTTELRRARDRAADSADLVELRLDSLRDIDVAGALQGRTKPVIVTCRPTWEGGAFGGSEIERLRILSEAVRLGAEFVDVEWRADRSGIPAGDRTRLVLSLHDFGGLPPDLASVVRSMRAAAGHGVIKVAAATATPRDCVRLRDVTGHGSEQVVIGMGAAGIITRVCPWLFDSSWSYSGTVAPGQTTTHELSDVYRVRSTGPNTRIYALIGAPLAHSASPAMLNAAFAAAEIDAVYVPMETRDPAGVLVAAESLGIVGASVTAPLKSGWSDRGVEIDDVGAAVGAINTLKRSAGGWVARNFDVDGFLAPLKRRGVPLSGLRCVVLGAGGAARAVAWALHREGATVTLCARRPDPAAALAADLHVTSADWPPAGAIDMLVNATPVGTWPDADRAPMECGAGTRVAYDLVYNPADTRWLRQAREVGAETIGGLEMLIAQAESQFTFWTDQPVPAGVMERAATTFLRQRNA